MLKYALNKNYFKITLKPYFIFNYFNITKIKL